MHKKWKHEHEKRCDKQFDVEFEMWKIMKKIEKLIVLKIVIHQKKNIGKPCSAAGRRDRS